MTRYVFLIVLAFVVAACGIPPTPTGEQASIQAVVGGATGATNTMKAPIATPNPPAQTPL